MDQVKKLVGDYLQETILLQLATVAGERPWVCTVHYAYDDQWNFYFLSKPTRRHSEELAANPRVAGAIVRAHAVGEDVQGIQFEGTAARATGDDLAPGQAAYKARYGFDITDNHNLYVIKPERLVWFDAINFPDHPQREVSRPE